MTLNALRFKLIFVCTGNLYRSQAAEIMARKIFQGTAETGSAGVSEASAENHKIPKRLVEALRGLGYFPDEEARSKKVTLSQIHDASKILYMQDSHAANLWKMFPRMEKRRFSPLARYSPSLDLEKIQDLAFIHDTKKFRGVLVDIEACIQGLYRELSTSGSSHDN